MQRKKNSNGRCSIFAIFERSRLGDETSENSSKASMGGCALGCELLRILFFLVQNGVLCIPQKLYSKYTIHSDNSV